MRDFADEDHVEGSRSQLLPWRQCDVYRVLYNIRVEGIAAKGHYDLIGSIPGGGYPDAAMGEML